MPLDRFLNAQSTGEVPGGRETKYSDALAELQAGEKRNCWIWYVAAPSTS
jgi:uncharacterized protein (DUF1810 family)